MKLAIKYLNATYIVFFIVKLLKNISMVANEYTD
jgi:hypothetical protein